jgi:hypothetical protein
VLQCSEQALSGLRIPYSVLLDDIEGWRYYCVQQNECGTVCTEYGVIRCVFCARYLDIAEVDAHPVAPSSVRADTVLPHRDSRRVGHFRVWHLPSAMPSNVDPLLACPLTIFPDPIVFPPLPCSLAAEAEHEENFCAPTSQYCYGLINRELEPCSWQQKAKSGSCNFPHKQIRGSQASVPKLQTRSVIASYVSYDASRQVGEWGRLSSELWVTANTPDRAAR